MRPILTTMTALAVVMSTLPAAQAGKVPNLNIKPKVQVVKIRRPGVHVPSNQRTLARAVRQEDKPKQKDEPPANRGPAPVKPAPKLREVQVFTQLPRPRPDHPYNEFQETGNDSNVGPDTGLPEDDGLFDETLVALLPGLWGQDEYNVLEDASNGALDKAFDNAPDPVGPFGHRDDGRPDLTDFEPGGYVQPGGPNDPAAGGPLPEFFDDPFAQPGNDESQGWRSPSQALNDPRGMASDGSARDEFNKDGSGRRIEEHEDGSSTTTEYDRDGKIVAVHQNDADGRIVSTIRYDNNSGAVVFDAQHFYDANGNRTTYRHDWKTGRTEIWQHGRPVRPDQPGVDPSTQEQAQAQAWICNNTPWMCRSGGGGSTPSEMLTQPAQPDGGTGSIMDTDDGPALGREAVTNTGDASWNTTDSRGSGGGGGSSSTPDESLGQPGPDGPGGPGD